MIAAPLLAAGMAFGISLPALSDEVPFNPPPGAVVTSSGGFYVWADGPWRSIRTVNPDAVPNTLEIDGSAPSVAAGNPAPVNEGIRTGIGYVFPNGTFSPTLGSKVRTEFGAGQTRAIVPLAPGSQSGIVGDGPNGTIIGGCAGCRDAVSTDFSRTQTTLRAASDFQVRGLTLTPSLSVFGANNRQAFMPVAASDPGATLQWNDWGAKVGVDGKVGVANNLTLDLGGSVGVAHREATLIPNPSGGAYGATTAPALANAQAQLNYKPAADLELKTFAGVNSFDSRAPAVVAPGAGGHSGSGMKFSPEAGYFAGAGATFKFGTR
jgi:hypothetical protein